MDQTHIVGKSGQPLHVQYRRRRVAAFRVRWFIFVLTVIVLTGLYGITIGLLPLVFAQRLLKGWIRRS